MSEPTAEQTVDASTLNQVYKTDAGLVIFEITKLVNPDGTKQDLPLGHYYAAQRPDGQLIFVQFQDGTIPQVGVNGLTNEAVLAMTIHRTETLNGQFPDDDNELAILHMKKALEAFDSRTAKRKARGVEGQHKA